MVRPAIRLARLRRLYFGAYDPQGGGVEHGARIFDQADLAIIAGDLWRQIALASGGRALLLDFFQRRR